MLASCLDCKGAAIEYGARHHLCLITYTLWCSEQAESVSYGCIWTTNRPDEPIAVDRGAENSQETTQISCHTECCWSWHQSCYLLERFQTDG